MNRNQIGLHKLIGLALALMLALFVVACGGATAGEPAAVPVEEQAAVAQEPAEEADDHSEGEAHDEGEAHEEEGEHHDEEGEHSHDEEGEHHDEEGEHDHEGEDEHREHGAHEHGAATLTIAWSGNDMEMELDTPAFNLFGFEYEPSTDEEIQLVEDSLSELESGALMILNDEAGCRLNEAHAATAWDEEGHHDEDDHADHEEHAEDEDGETHSDVVAHFELTCDAPDEISTLDLGPLFDRFPNFEDLDVQWVSDTTQSSAELTADSSLLSLR